MKAEDDYYGQTHGKFYKTLLRTSRFSLVKYQTVFVVLTPLPTLVTLVRDIKTTAMQFTCDINCVAKYKL